MDEKNEKKVEGKSINRRDFLELSFKGMAVASSVGFASGCAGPKLKMKPDQYAGGTGQKRKSYIDAYHFDDCIECGACLTGCLYKDLNEEEAIDGIKRLREGKKVDDLLNRCTFCGKCNHRCPVDADPTALMLERLRDRREKERRVPASLAFVINGMSDRGWNNNAMRKMQSGLDKEEKKILQGWAEFKNNTNGDLLFCGCGSRICPTDLENSKVLADLPKFGGIDDCCGLIAGRGGLFDVATHIQDNLFERFSQSKFKRLVVVCGSCQEGLTLLRPHYLDQEVPFEIISIYQYIEEQMNAGKATIQRTADIDAALSDACFGYEFGEEYLQLIDRLATASGFKTTRLAHNKDNNACCGMGGYFSRGSLWDVSRAKKIKEKDIKESGKKDVLSYCQGCYLNTHFMQPGKHHYLLEKILWALGDEIKDPYSKISKKVNSKVVFGSMKIIPSAIF